ncbi:GNAT family N-acetyltransferase [Haloferax sp. YSMS24]|uniref:GNAT family N-acetyltransferase n=1 Tax=Haloferax sp. YSMS24 TaxID=3388425 RepID=UPI00398D3CAE
MERSITVRPPQSVAEMRGVWQVNVRCWVEAYDHILPDDALPDPDDTPDDDTLHKRFEYANMLDETDSGRYVVAVDESTPGDETGVVGFAATRWGDETKSFVDDDDAGLWVIYVDPARWGEGIGSSLLDDVTSAVPSRYDHLVLETFADNHAAQQFYRTKEFEVVERAETDVGGDTYHAVIMARSLGE